MTVGTDPILSARDVTYGFPERPEFLHPVNLDVVPGQCWGIIGPNGAGKSTLLRLLAGRIAPSSGTIRLEGRNLNDVPIRQRATRIAYLPQHMPTDLRTSARDIVLMGRFPHRRFCLFESRADHEIARQALATTEASALADRPLAALSGGEVQRVHIAAAIAQQPVVMLLDEPAASLDLYHQLNLFQMLEDLARRDGTAVVVVSHDINLAARYCSHVLLLDEGHPVASGTPAEVMRPETLESAFAVELRALDAGTDAGRWIVALRPRKASVNRMTAGRGDA